MRNRKKVKAIKVYTTRDCGGKRGKGGCGSWAGATEIKTKIQIAA